MGRMFWIQNTINSTKISYGKKIQNRGFSQCVKWSYVWENLKKKNLKIAILFSYQIIDRNEMHFQNFQVTCE